MVLGLLCEMGLADLSDIHTYSSFSHLIKIPRNGNAVFEECYSSKKVNSSGARPDDFWIKSLMLIHLS